MFDGGQDKLRRHRGRLEIDANRTSPSPGTYWLPKLLLDYRTFLKFNFTSHSCGVYTLKYMLSWDGEEMTEHFTQVSKTLISMCTLVEKEHFVPAH